MAHSERNLKEAFQFHSLEKEFSYFVSANSSMTAVWLQRQTGPHCLIPRLLFLTWRSGKTEMEKETQNYENFL